ncbi:hypothetical protein ACJMK2_023726 [Sinanodonta woodiana]|uniref:VLIG-type G domain-containing protein n=1 Tax=Sinanodonta woodiana TaxID=1069815 RepID=A0ABD3T5C1_SINWO
MKKCTNIDQIHDSAGEIRENGSHILEQVILESHVFNETAWVPKSNEIILGNDMEFTEFNNVLKEDQNQRADDNRICIDTETANDNTNQDYCVSEDRLSKVLNILNLNEKYPGSFTCSDMYRITKSSLFDEQPNCHNDLAHYFLQKIAKYNYTAREFNLTEGFEHKSSSAQKGQKSKFRQMMEESVEENLMKVSPMDVIIAVFLCCDDICKQDLVSHMWSCRLAVPLIIQEKVLPSQPSCYLWPLRSLVMRWETEVKEGHCVREGRLVKEAVTSIAFIRFGKVSVSKSAIINSVISGSEKTHSIFMNRDSPGSTKYRYLVDGMIDIGWYFPTPKTEVKLHGCFQDAVMFLNLHGDAYEFQSQLELLSKLANTITVMCTVTDFDRCRNILKSYVDRGNTFLIMFTDQEINTEDEAVIDDVLDYLKANYNQIQFVEVLDTNKAELLKETRSKLSQLSKGKFMHLEDILSLNVRVSIDEKTSDHLESKDAALIVSNMVRKTPYKERKNIHIPLQGDPWIAWAKADKDRLRTTNKRRNEDVDSYMADRAKIMKTCRSQQMEMLTKGANNALLQLFLKSISTDNDRKRKLFLRWLKYELDDLSREELRPVYKRYQQIIKNLATVEEQVKVAQKVELEKLDKEVTLLSFGLEHILREMGQTYEALISTRSSIPLFKYNLPDLAAKIHLDGYPFELLDGHVNSVPLCWVKDVLNAVDHALKQKLNVKDVRTKVISALGIQSSGKSTMLNALFGCQYAVSAGRCTRGAYCQFIEVDEHCRELLGSDLVLAIDTEGLRAPELSAGDQMVKHDNELSTFVIGLADTTILNLMGENTTYLDELLPISVHAFLRMEMATNFKPKCVIIHQNVNREDDEKLINQGRILEEKLNKMTQLASSVERAETKSFNDIIDFEVGRDVFYVSALLEGIQPMAPISTRYSEELNAFKQALLKKDDKVQTSLASFVSHLNNLWSNIKKDDFVYQFRNTIETEARRKLDDFWCHANCSFRQPINKMVETGYVKLQNCTDINQLNGLVKLLDSDLKGAINKEYQNQKCTFNKFLDESDTLMKETMMRWSTDMDKRFDDLRNDLVKETSAKLQEFDQDKKRKFSLKQGMQGYERKLKAEIEELFSAVKSTEHTPVSEHDISSLFEKHWKDWTTEIIRENPRHEARIDIKSDAFEAIVRSFSNGREYLTTYVKKKNIDRYDRCDFDVNEIVSITSRVTSFFGLSNYKECIKNLEKDLFDLVDAKLETRRQVVRPYTSGDIDELVVLVKETLESKRKTTKTKIKHDVYFEVLVCGYAIKRLRKFHEEYESQNNLENVLESLKKHYFGMFKSLFNETERLNLIANNCNEILKMGILEKMTRTFTGKIVIGMDNDSFIRKEKSWTMLALLIDTARTGSFDDFTTLIQRPEKSLSCYISKLVENYFNQDVNPLHCIFKSTLDDIRQEISLILEKTFSCEKKSFETWLKTLQKNAEEVIVLENIDRLKDLGKNKDIDFKLLHEKLKNGLKRTVSVIASDMQSYLSENRNFFKTKVVEQIKETIIGCTESCPFCGAVCMVAYADHKSEHYTTLHRPQGCKRWHYLGTKVLVTITCPMSVASKNLQFRYMQNYEKMFCLYKDYKTIYPEWYISADETGEETSLWNWFFAEHAKKIAGDDLVIPEIPQAWKELDKETEIDKLNNMMQINWKTKKK